MTDTMRYQFEPASSEAHCQDGIMEARKVYLGRLHIRVLKRLVQAMCGILLRLARENAPTLPSRHPPPDAASITVAARAAFQIQLTGNTSTTGGTSPVGKTGSQRCPRHIRVVTPHR